MARRPGFCLSKGKISSKSVEFTWAPGFAVSQKKKNVKALHEALGGKALEVSTKSDDILGKKLSAFNLKLNGYTLENVFQAGKVFENGGPYEDLLDVSPKDAKHDERLKTSGKLIGFMYNGEMWPLEPKSVFYDFIYCMAVKACVPVDELKELENYDYFTDIEFNPEKSINTQARAIVLVKKFMELYGEIPDINPTDFVKFHQVYVVA